MTHTNPVRQLKLHSPAGIEPAVFTWLENEQQNKTTDGTLSRGDEIVQTIRLVFEDYPELYQDNLVLDHCDAQSYAQIKELCDRFNKIIDTYVKLNRGTEAFSARIQQRATSKLFRHLLAQVYSRAVTDPDKLREYEPFSPSVYGETSPDLLDSILKSIDLTEDETFLDLGSGVGNIVLQVAALTNCKYVYGIEHESIPATYAAAMADEFRFWMHWYGKCYSDFQLEQGDFLHHLQMDERIRDADVIFVNNYVFGSTVNHELKIKFMTMKDGARIISSREFCPGTFRLNDRTKNDLGAVMYVTKPEDFYGKVSWSDKCVQYYLHVIDHRKLAHYYEKAHRHHPKGSKSSHVKSSDDDQSFSSSLSSPSTQSSSNSSDSATERKSTKLPRDSVTTCKRKDRHKRLSASDAAMDSDRDYQTRLNELHRASKEFIHVNQKRKMSNDDINCSLMSRSARDSLHRSNVLLDLEDDQSSSSINSYLENFRQRLFTYSTYMNSDVYREHVQKQLNTERELNQSWKTKITCLENNIKGLLEDTIQLLKLRTDELGVDQLERPEQLITYANGISNKHKELRLKVISLEKEIAEYDDENNQINTILINLRSNPYASSTVSGPSLHDTTYSTLLANMSKQTQHETAHRSHPSSTSSTVGHRETAVSSNQDAMPSSKRMKFDGTNDFIIQKRSQKMAMRNALGADIVPSIHPTYPGTASLPITSLLPSTLPTGIDNLLSTKELQPMQVHSVVSSAGCAAKPEKSAPVSITRSFNIKNLISGSSSSKGIPSNESETSSHDLAEPFPRKKRDFYGRSSSPSPQSPASDGRSSRHSQQLDPLASTKRRPSSTPASPDALAAAAVSDRPSSIPLLNSSI